mmetsp:Transcript_18923/g.66844  ORF Transcript_18923/g.66844 Transcript_18923/m.66844 type:complete len:222 (-) Transcript_18923:396-1061(-)
MRPSPRLPSSWPAFRSDNLETRHATKRRSGKQPNVISASATDTSSGVQTSSTIAIHAYARTEEAAVVRKTRRSWNLRTSPAGRPTTQIEMMTMRLNEAEPTIVDGPSSSGVVSSVCAVPMTASSTSGADEPSAMSDRFAMVGCHTLMVTVSLVPVVGFTRSTLLSLLVMTSMPAMKTSAMMATPRKQYMRPNRYRKMRTPGLHRFSAGKSRNDEHTLSSSP